jgi:predicted nuclease of predicted toxin-antitoxin system
LKLLLNAMFAPEIARQLRRLGHDVVAAKERPDLADADDPEVFEIAQAESASL